MIPEVVKDTRSSWLGLHNLKIMWMAQRTPYVHMFKISAFGNNLKDVKNHLVLMSSMLGMWSTLEVCGLGSITDRMYERTNLVLEVTPCFARGSPKHTHTGWKRPWKILGTTFFFNKTLSPDLSKSSGMKWSEQTTAKDGWLQFSFLNNDSQLRRTSLLRGNLK